MALALASPLQTALAQSFYWELPDPPVLTLAPSKISEDLKTTYHSFNIHCDSSSNETRHLITYTDKAGNTVDIYCQNNPWIPSDERQYIAFYNDKIIVGLCPWDRAANRHEISTNEDGEIDMVHWLSIRTNASDYVTYNNFLG